MITGIHALLHSKDADATRALFRDVLGFSAIDAGRGWLIFGLPPSEVAVHPGDNEKHEFYLMCDDVEGFIADMKKRKVKCGPIHDQPWGRLTEVTLPGGGKLGVYEPKHARPKSKA